MKINRILTTAALLLAATVANAENVFFDTYWIDGVIQYSTSQIYVSVVGEDNPLYYYKFESGKTYTFQASVILGHEITMWSMGDPKEAREELKHFSTVVETTSDTYEWTNMPSKDQTLAVHQDWLKYNIAFNANGGMGEMDAMQNLVYTNEVALTENEFTKVGYSFQGWSRTKKDAAKGVIVFEDGDTVDGKILNTDYKNKDITLYAVWKPNTYTVTLDATGGRFPSGVGVIATDVTYDSTYGELPTPSRADQGYDFNEWTNALGQAIKSTTEVKTAANHTLYASWTKRGPYTIQVVKCPDEPGADGIVVGSGTYDWGTSAYLQATRSEGSRFVKWTKNAQGGETVSTDAEFNLVVYEKATYFGHFALNEYTVTFKFKDAQGNDTNVVKKVKYGHDAVPPTAPDYSHYLFSKWDKDYQSIKGDTTIVAVYISDQIKATFNPNGGTVLEATKTLQRNKPCGELPEPTRKGYYFNDWHTVDGTLVTSDTICTWTEDITLVAWWTAHTYTIYFDGNGGSGTMSSISCTWDEQVSLPANDFERKGYTFLGWCKDARSKIVKYTAGQEVKNLTTADSITLFAVWTANTYTVRFDRNGGTGEQMADMAAKYDCAFILSKASYSMANRPFTGWLGSDNKTYADCATVSNLTDEAGSVFTMKATYGETYTVAFDGNGETDGRMALQYVDHLEWTPLSSNCYVRTGYSFMGWAKDKESSDAWVVKYKDCEKVRKLADVGEGVQLFAVWTNNRYRVVFYPNGGEGVTYEQWFTYDEKLALLPNAFSHNPYSFNGWLTDPTNAVASFKDQEAVKNLTADKDGCIKLFAKWSSASPVTSDLAKAADSNVELTADPADWCSVIKADKGYAKGNEQCIELKPQMYDKNAVLTLPTKGTGTLTFYYKRICSQAYEEWLDDYSDISLFVDGKEQKFGQSLSGVCGEWCKEVYCISNVAEKIQWKAISWGFNKGENLLDFAVRLDGISWALDKTTVGITYRLNDGTVAPADIWSNATYTTGKAIGKLPAATRKGAEFLGWSTTPTGGTLIDENWEVPTEDTQLYAQWVGIVEVPTAAKGLVYTGNLQTGVVETAGFTLSNNTATDAGSYNATATLKSGYRWSDGQTQVKSIPWSISTAVYDMRGVTFTNATYVVDGQPKSLAISGTLPKGVTVSYVGNGQTAVGEHTVTAKFTGDEKNYEKIADMTATLTIKDGPPVEVEKPTAVGGLVYNGQALTGVVESVGFTLTDNVKVTAGSYTAVAALQKGYVWADGTTASTEIAWSIAKAKYNMSGVGFANETVKYDGQPHSLTISGALPVGVTNVCYEGNSQTNVGTYTVTAKFTGDDKNYEKIADMTATLTITKATYDMSGVTFTNAMYVADGTPKSLAISGELPKGVKVDYVGNGQTAVGTYTVTAKFTGDDDKNYEKIADKKATLTIVDVPRTPVEKPKSIGGLVYNGQAQTGVVASAGYTLVGNVATNAGDYVAIATPDAGFCWEGGQTNALKIAWSIAKATYDVSGVMFTNATYVIDGTAKSLAVSGELPKGVKVDYVGNGQMEIGSYEVTAKFMGDAKNYEKIADKTATLTLVDRDADGTTVAYANRYFSAMLAELDGGVVPGVKDTVKLESLPAGLKLVKSGTAATGFAYTITGVPTETLDGVTRIAYVRITDAQKNERLLPLHLRIVSAPVYRLPDGTLGDDYGKFNLASLWPDVAENPSDWTFTGWPAGLKYVAKDGAVKGRAAGEVYGTPTKAGRYTVKGVRKLYDPDTGKALSFKDTYQAEIVIWGDDEKTEWIDPIGVQILGRKIDQSTAVTGLPSGLVYRQGIVSGTPTKSGTFAVTVTGTDKTKRSFIWTISAAEPPECALDFGGSLVVDPVTASRGIHVGVGYAWPVELTEGAKIAVSGLPTGLKLVTTQIKDGRTVVGTRYDVKGIPTKAGAFVAVFKATRNGQTTVATYGFTVAALPDWAQGTFDGGTEDALADVGGGQATFTVTKAGKISGKWLNQGMTWTFAAASFSRYSRDDGRYVADLVFKAGTGKTLQSFTNELFVAADDVRGGVASNELFIACLNRWNQEPWKTIGKSIAKAPTCMYVPAGFGANDTITLKVAASGKVTVTGKFQKSVDDRGRISWYTASGSAVLCPQTSPDETGSFDGVVFVYLPPKANTPLAEGYSACVWVRWDGSSLTVWSN